MITLDIDHQRGNQFPADYETDLESEWANPSNCRHDAGLIPSFVSDLFADGDDFSSLTLERRRNLHYQQQLAHRINHQMVEIMSLLTSALKIHVNLGQQAHVNEPASLLFAYERVSGDSLITKPIQLIGSARVWLPLNITNHSVVSVRVGNVNIDQTSRFLRNPYLDDDASFSSS